MSLYIKKHDLFWNYIKELNDKLSREDYLSELDIWQQCEYYINSDSVKWENIFYDDSLIGFMLVGHTKDSCFKDCDKTLLDAYVDPMYRGLKLFKKAFLSYVMSKPAKWAIRCIKEDASAISIFNHVFSYGLSNSKKVGEFDDDDFRYLVYEIS